MDFRLVILSFLAAILSAESAPAKALVLDSGLHHLRVNDPREWSDFPTRPQGPSLSLRFHCEANSIEWALRLRQQDVKQTWKVLLNGKELGRLVSDENDEIIYLPVPAGRLVAGENQLRIEQIGRTPDDIRVGEIILEDRPIDRVLSEATVELSVMEVGRSGGPLPTPCRITVLNAQGALMSVGATSDDHLAVRPGVVYSGDGKAALRPARRRLHHLCRARFRVWHRHRPRLGAARRRDTQNAVDSPGTADRRIRLLRHAHPYAHLFRPR